MSDQGRRTAHGVCVANHDRNTFVAQARNGGSSVFAAISGPIPARSPRVTASVGLVIAVILSTHTHEGVFGAESSGFRNLGMPSALPPTTSPNGMLEHRVDDADADTSSRRSAARAPSPPIRPSTFHRWRSTRAAKAAPRFAPQPKNCRRVPPVRAE